MEDTLKKTREIIDAYDGPKLRIMEVCGTHTHEIFRLGIRQILPETIEMISGPGCPVCVTPPDYLDEAIWLALKKDCVICTFGDLIRVPGSEMSLAGARAQGAQIRTVYTPLDAVEIAADHPESQVVFLSVGFETTIPACCLAVKKARERGLLNFSILTANKTMPGAYETLKGSADAFLYPGHVHAIIGEADCRRLLSEGVSGVIAGFTAKELMAALAVIAERSTKGEPFFVNCYPRVVRPEGNPAGMALMHEVMEPCDAQWRGLGIIPESGLTLREEYADFDARKKFDVPQLQGRTNPACRCGEVLQGKCTPSDCPMFGTACTPDQPVGACMVSSEGACSAYFQYR
ncbi:MAG: hydrogenase formation protein HypD [Lachnospiraceae bacterium]|nr:hydrogenase formation protein HypD [Lachnospiraceae bacterium]